MVLRNGSTNFDRLSKDVNERKEAGAYPTTEFEICELKEYNVEATNFATPAGDADPFSAQNEEQSPWEI